MSKDKLKLAYLLFIEPSFWHSVGQFIKEKYGEKGTEKAEEEIYDFLVQKYGKEDARCLIWALHRIIINLILDSLDQLGVEV